MSHVTTSARIFATAVLVVCTCAIVRAQQAPSPPKQEVRAVWITTAAGLDWPKTVDRVGQQSALREIVANLKAAHFNTILFQVRARGDAYYRSSYEPWAENLTGVLGKDPGWDPLAFLLAEAHAAGLEVHAWFNVYKVRGQSSVGMSVPLHPARRFAASLYEVDGEGWLDPGVPEVRDYLVRVALELVRAYDIDGINLDFIRYPGRTFVDGESFRRYGNGMGRDEWRRSNIDRFVAALYDSAMRLKPMLKVGSAPLGVFSVGSGANSWGAFSSYYQDSQGWLARRKHDYLVPQLYWDFEDTKGDPGFADLLRSWNRASSGRQLWSGIGAYKPEVMRELPQQIDSSRILGADGQSFFRYEHVSDPGVFGGRYATLANIPPMSWKDSISPLPPRDLAVTETNPSIFHLEWLGPSQARDGDRARYYNVYRSTSGQIRSDDAGSLVAITSTNATFFMDTVHAGDGYKYYYAVSALDKGNNESPLSGVSSVTLKELTDLRGKLSEFTSLSTSLAHDDETATLVAYNVASRSSVSLQVVGQGADSTRGVVLMLASGVQNAGTYIVAVPGNRLQSGSYAVRLVAGGVTIEQPMDVRR